MGIKALVDFSLIRELCEGIPKKGSKRTFKAKLKSKKDERQATSFEKVDEIKRLLVSDAKKTKEDDNKRENRKRKRSEEPRKPARSTFTLAGSSSGESDSESSSQSDSRESSGSDFEKPGGNTTAGKDLERTS